MLGIENDWAAAGVEHSENGSCAALPRLADSVVLLGVSRNESALFQIENRDDATIVHVLGNIDFSAKAALRETLDLVERHASGAVIVDLNDCPYVDSEGLGELIRAHRLWGKRLSIVAPSHGVVARVLAISGLNSVFNLKSSVTDALLQVIG